MSAIIFLHGTCSSGKSSIARELKQQAPIPFWHFASDQLVEAGMLPDRINDGGAFDWRINRPKFFNAFHGCIRAILESGNNLILDHIIESEAWYDDLRHLLSGHDLFFVGVHCPLAVLQQRERQRSDKNIGNRYSGEAEYHLNHVHSYSEYDFEINTSDRSAAECAGRVLENWHHRRQSEFFNTP